MLLGLYCRQKTSWWKAIFRPSFGKKEMQDGIEKSFSVLSYFNQELITRCYEPITSIPLIDRRRIEIARALVGDPQVLLLDEPTAGLDPFGRRDLMARLRDLHYQEGIGVVIVSHALDEIAELVERLIVMREGRIVFDGRPSVAFEREELLARAGLDVPQGVATLAALRERGLNIGRGAVAIDDVAQAVADAVSGKGGGT